MQANEPVVDLASELFGLFVGVVARVSFLGVSAGRDFLQKLIICVFIVNLFLGRGGAGKGPEHVTKRLLEVGYRRSVHQLLYLVVESVSDFTATDVNANSFVAIKYFCFDLIRDFVVRP